MRMEAPSFSNFAASLLRVYLHAYGGTVLQNLKRGQPMGLSPCVWRHL